jgi:hypothetical protein
MITKYRDVSGNYLNYIPLLRPFSTIAERLGLSKNEDLMKSIGKRRYGYHAALQANLRKEIELGVDKPWYVTLFFTSICVIADQTFPVSKEMC